jgi:hypothetical protein
LAFADAVGVDPVALELLDQPLVAWRDGDGGPHVRYSGGRLPPGMRAQGLATGSVREPA